MQKMFSANTRSIIAINQCSLPTITCLFVNPNLKSGVPISCIRRFNGNLSNKFEITCRNYIALYDITSLAGVLDLFQHKNMCCFETFWNSSEPKKALNKYVSMITPLRGNSYIAVLAILHQCREYFYRLYVFVSVSRANSVGITWRVARVNNFFIGLMLNGISCSWKQVEYYVCVKQGAQKIGQHLLHHFLAKFSYYCRLGIQFPCFGT